MRGGERIKEKEQLIPQMKLLTPLFGSFYPDDREKDVGQYDENRTQAELLDGKDLALIKNCIEIPPFAVIWFKTCNTASIFPYLNFVRINT